MQINIRPPDFRLLNSVRRGDHLVDWVLREQRRLARKRLPKEKVEVALGQAFWRSLAREWTTFDAIDHFSFELLFQRFRPSWSIDYWQTDDAKFFGELPERLKIFRGQSADHAVGLSFTTDLSVAKGFRRGHRGIRVANPVIVEVEVNRADVALATNARKEHELVLFEPPAGLGATVGQKCRADANDDRICRLN